MMARGVVRVRAGGRVGGSLVAGYRKFGGLTKDLSAGCGVIGLAALAME